MVMMVYCDPLYRMPVWLWGMTPLFTCLSLKIGVFSSSNAHISFNYVILLLRVDILYLFLIFVSLRL